MIIEPNPCVKIKKNNRGICMQSFKTFYRVVFEIVLFKC